MRPTISALCLGVSIQIEHLNITIPKRFTLKNLFYMYRFAPDRSAIMQLHYRNL